MVTSQTFSKIKWFVPTFISVIVFIWEIEKELGFQHDGWEWFAMNFLIASVLVLSIYVFFHYADWRFAKFLKAEDEQPVFLVVGAYKDTREWSPEKPKNEKERYFKQKNGSKFPLEGAHGYLTGLETTRMVSQFVYRLRDLTNRRLIVVRDDIMPSEAGPLVCFGSPRSNFQSEAFLPAFIKFADAKSLTVTINSTPMPYFSDNERDYGIVARNKVGDRWAFICAGIDEEGTIAAGYYLLEQWKSLHKYSESFVHIISCTKTSPESPQRFLGFSPGPQGEWLSDSRT